METKSKVKHSAYRAEMEKAYRKSQREYQKSLSPEERERQKQNKVYDKQMREDQKRELAILEFMVKTDVLYYHHGRSESMAGKAKSQITKIKKTGRYDERNSYIWNYYGEGNNTMSRSLLGNLFNSGSTDFETIYDVPLDGTYKFVVWDSGQRGLGSFDYIKPVKVEEQVKVPYVSPGAFPPISY